MLRDVNTNVTDGLLGFSNSKGDGVHVKIGASSITSDSPIIITGDMTAAKIKERLGLSPLADSAMDSVEWGANRILCIPVAASTAGTVGAVTKTGTGVGSVAIAGTPTNAFDLVVKITAAGSLNAAAFVFSINGGYSYSDELTVPLSGTYVITGTGLTITFTKAAVAEQEANSFLVGDTYTASSTAPVMTNADVLAAITALQTYSDEEYEFVHIVGESALALWQAVSTAQIELRDTFKKPMFFVLEAYKPNTSEDIEDYGLRLKADRAKISNYDIQVVAARGLLVKMDGTTHDVNLAGLVAGLYAKASVQVCIGKTSDAAGFGVTKAKLLELRPKGIEKIIEMLDTAGYLTFRGYDGLSKYYVYHTNMMIPSGSDYPYAEDARVRNKIIRETRKEGLLLLQDDIDLEDVQGELEAKAKFMFPPLQTMINNKEISSAEITVPDGQEESVVTSGKMSVKIRYFSRGYIREIAIDLGRSPLSE